jgi:ATPase subunit of ABC transporter with duplicated ATPase domains
MTTLSEDDLSKLLTKQLLNNGGDDSEESLDEDMIGYLSAMLGEFTLDEMTSEEGSKVEEGGAIFDAIQPFLEGHGCTDDIIATTCQAVTNLASKKASANNKSGSRTSTHTVLGKKDNAALQKLSKGVSMAQALQDSEADSFMWGNGEKQIKANSNTQRDAHKDTESAKVKRTARKELEKERRVYETRLKALEAEEEENSGKAVANMVLPDYNTGRNERDIQVRKVNLSLDNGRAILDDAELRFSSKHRYGLVGKNGIGKTTLLKAIARMDIPGFPRHHRVLHVRQEVSQIPKSILEARTAEGIVTKELPVMQIVIESDVERNTLLQEEKGLLKRLEMADEKTSSSEDAPPAITSALQKRQQLLAKQKAGGMDPKFANDLKRLDEVYARLAMIGADAAEARASMILSGLQFTPEMQAGPMSDLSGGWKMRVSLAAALFIEPDLLMLDEPTNHLDLEAVLWLESYLTEYKYTVIVVSHDRGFLNEVCSDIIEFANLKLTCKCTSVDACSSHSC